MAQCYSQPYDDARTSGRKEEVWGGLGVPAHNSHICPKIIMLR